jgi:hypothetical protein
MRWMNCPLACLLILAGSAPAADTLIVCPPALRPALAPWVEYRAAQGRTFAWVESVATAGQVRAGIRTHAAGNGLKAIVLVGDVDNHARPFLGPSPYAVPTFHAAAKVNVRYGSEPQIATDNWYADLDDDGLPDVAIGRLTADSPGELAAMVRKIINYEQSRDFGRWRQRVNLVAGLGGFGMLVDSALELVARKLITDGIPASYATTMTFGSWRSPFCPDPRDFHGTTITRLTEGCQFWVYLGHGQPHSLDRVSVPGSLYHILGTADMPLVAKSSAARRAASAPVAEVDGGAIRGNSSAAPLAFFLACYTGAFDAPQDCLAEELLRTEGGPVAVVSGSRVTMPYAMAVLGTELLSECFWRRRETLGEALLSAKRNSMLRERTDPTSQLLDNLAGLLGPAGTDLKAERAEHLLLFNLLGDPLLRLRHPREVRLEVSGDPVPGQELIVHGRSPVDGAATVELVVRRDRLTFTPPARDVFDPSPMGLAEYRRVYERANDPRLCTQEVEVEGGKLQASFRIPSTAAGACHVRVFVEGTDEFALGSVDVQVEAGR